MGDRHNRRRTRAPRSSRTSNKFDFLDLQRDVLEARTSIAVASSIPRSPSSYSSVSVLNVNHNLPARHWHNRYAEWQQRKEAETKRKNELELERQQRRVFGGEDGDEGELCLPMLMVVVGLFGGVDYVDP
ncbi:MAG: hypothetical protein M1827_003373 [Pycnora praestabilis]|nr:MAG: hypothetical protein M1827_003373 [Pycnora praestabilis]